MDTLTLLLNNYHFTEDIYKSFSNLSPDDYKRLALLAKSASYNNLNDAIEWYEFDYDIEPDTELDAEQVKHFEEWLISKRDNTSEPEHYKSFKNITIPDSIPQLINWDDILKNKAYYEIQDIDDETWYIVQHFMPEFIKVGGFIQLYSIVIPPSFINALKKVKRSGWWDLIKESLNMIIPALIAGKITRQFYNLHYYKGKSFTIGAHWLGTQHGLLALDMGDGTIELTDIDTNHGLAD